MKWWGYTGKYRISKYPQDKLGEFWYSFEAQEMIFGFKSWDRITLMQRHDSLESAEEEGVSIIKSRMSEREVKYGEI